MIYAGDGGGLDQTAGGINGEEWQEVKPRGLGYGLDAGNEERKVSGLHNRRDDNTLL